jgi:aspartate aminotransferase
MVEIMIWNPVKSDKRRIYKMISEKMKPYVKNNSAIRMMFEEGNRLRAKYGADKVFDFSLGNPSVPAPDSVREAIIELVNTTDPTVLHGYMSNAGFEDVRQTIAESLNRRFDTKFSAKNLIMTVGAASGLNVVLKTILNPGEEVIVFAPYFLEYGAYVRNYDGILVEVSPDTTTFQPNLAEFEQRITPKTRAVIVNTPHNPTGVVYSEETIKKLSAILEAKQKEFGTVIYLISDEPYRELAYDGVEVPYLTKYYNNTVVGYSYSKSLSLPGERIGYLVIPDEADGSEELISAATIANRTLGCVNAPSLIQKVVAKCVDAKTDLAAYDKNRQALYNGLKECGFECIKPQGAFYLFVKSPVEDEKAFCEAGKKYNILMVPGSSFACPGYVRLAYCVSYETIVNSLPEFKKLAAEYGLK